MDCLCQPKSPSAARVRPARLSPLEFVQRLAALVPRPRLHLIRFGARVTSLRKVSGPPLREPWCAGTQRQAARAGGAAGARAAGAGHTARRVRDDLRAPPPGAAELGQAAQARLGYDITWVQVSLRRSFAFEIDMERSRTAAAS